MKKNIVVMASLIVVLRTVSMPSDKGTVPQIPRTLSNARFVYVAAYDGDQFDPNLLPEDRAAIGRVQDAIEKWGKLTLVYRPEYAVIILMVQSRPSEELLVLYEAYRGYELRPRS